MLETILAICLGIGLSAACGFRVFVPMLVISVAAKADWLTLAENFAWIGSWPAIIAFSVATVLEIGAYYLPWLDNLLDTIAVPLATVAGIVVTAACVVTMDPLLKWTLAIVAGGGVAGTVKTGLAGLRAGSTAATAGVANPIFSTLEWIGSLVMTFMSLVLPILAAAVALVLAIVLLRFAVRLCAYFFARTSAKPAANVKESANSAE